jgi:hypothetical protein
MKVISSLTLDDRVRSISQDIVLQPSNEPNGPFQAIVSS